MNAKFKWNSFTKAICCFGTLAISFLQINVSHAQGTPLLPGGGYFITSGALGPIGGTLINTITIPFSSTSFTGDLTSSVISGDTSNLLGGLTFTYQYSINTGPDSSEGISLGGFTGFLTDVSYQIPPTGVPPVLVSRSVTGNNIEFNFVPQVSPGLFSALLVVQTDAQTWNIGTSTVLDNTGSPNVAILTPVAVVVPEPASAGFVLLGLGMMFCARRFRKVELLKQNKI